MIKAKRRAFFILLRLLRLTLIDCNPLYELYFDSVQYFSGHGYYNKRTAFHPEVQVVDNLTWITQDVGPILIKWVVQSTWGQQFWQVVDNTYIMYNGSTGNNKEKKRILKGLF